MVNKGSHLVSFQSRSPNTHQQFPNTSFRTSTLSTCDSAFPYWGLLRAAGCAFGQGSAWRTSVWEMYGVQEKGRQKIKREGQREGKVPRLYRPQSAERTGGTRRKITFSKLQYLLFDRDTLINQLWNADNKSSFCSPDHFSVNCWVFQTAKGMQAITSWTNSSPIAWELAVAELSVSSGSSDGGISFKML